MQLQKLKDTITVAEDTEIDAAKNEEVFMELIQFLWEMHRMTGVKH